LDSKFGKVLIFQGLEFEFNILRRGGGGGDSVMKGLAKLLE